MDSFVGIEGCGGDAWAGSELQQFIIDPGTGESIKQWCLSGTEDIVSKIQSAKSLAELSDIYRQNHSEELLKHYSDRKTVLNQFSNSKSIQNGR